MAKTLLQGINQVLKFAGWIKGNSGEITSLTDPQRQVVIDQALQSWNEVIIDLYAEPGVMLEKEIALGSITLSEGVRAYALPSNLSRLWWPLFNETTGAKCTYYEGGFQVLWERQIIETPREGRPLWACVRPTDGWLYIDSIPQATDEGYGYSFYYEKILGMTLATEVFPFNDDVYALLVPAVVEKMKMTRDEQSEARHRVSMAKYDRQIGMAIKTLTEQQTPLNYVYSQPYCPVIGEELGGSGGGGGGGGSGASAVTHLGVSVTHLGIVVTST